MTKGLALLVMDFQPEIVDTFPSADAVANTKHVLEAVRAQGIPVAYVVVGFRPGHPEVAARNKGFAAAKAAGRLVDPKVIPELAPREGEPVVYKRRVGPLYGTDLPVLLSAFEAKHLILTGISTSGVILSTVRLAADMDFEITILEDCIADNDDEVHNFLLTKILPRQAKITTSTAFLAELTS